MGNHTFAAINAQEKYDILSSDMNDVMKSINDLIAKPDVTISDETYTQEIIMDSDYKVHGRLYYPFNAHQSCYVYSAMLHVSTNSIP